MGWSVFYDLWRCLVIRILSTPFGVHIGDNCIQNFHLGRYIVGYTVGNLVLRPPHT